MIRRFFALPSDLSIRTIGILLLLAALVYGITSIPYVLAYSDAPQGMTFGGALIWTPDQDCYFSFIRQSADGHWIFSNRLTSLEHSPAYFNLEWLIVGRIMALFHGSTVWAYHIWRAAGAVSVVFGFFALTRVVFRDPKLRWIALIVCVFGGTFRALFIGFNALSHGAESLLGWHLGELSTEFGYFAAHPFAQILANPHFAFPLGVFLLAIAAFLRGEATGKPLPYVIAGVLAALEASMRPYEMIVLYTFIPLFVVIESVLARKIDWRKLKLRALPLVIVAPVFAYTIFIFEFHPIFKYWASQGFSTPIPLSETFAHMGLVGLLLLLRACFIKKFPLSSPIERALLAWLVCVFLFIHANEVPFLRFMPYTPQLMTSLLPPAILLGVAVLDPTRWRWAAARPTLWIVLVTGMLAADAIDSIVLLRLFNTVGAANDPQVYIPTTEVQAFEWLEREASPEDVVLSLGKTGHRLTKNASVRVVSGHWCVTPKAGKMERIVEQFYRGKLSPAEIAAMLEECRVKWIYFGPMEGRLAEPLMADVPGFTRHVINDDVTIYGPSR